jgi:hypothetical protein
LADPQSQTENRKNRKAGIAPKHAKAETKVLNYIALKTIQRQNCYVKRRAGLCISTAIASIAMAQAPSTVAGPSYPLDLHTRWTYEMRQEFSPGVRAAGLDAPLVKGSVLQTTLVDEVVGVDLIDGVRYARVESRHDGRLWMTEWLRRTPEGLFLGKTNQDGQITVLIPPQKILSAQLTPEESWDWKASDAPVGIRTVVAGIEATDVPAGKFDATKTIHEMTMVLPQAKIRSSNSRWFAPGVGYVRQETETYAEDKLVSRTELKLVAFAAAPSRAPAKRGVKTGARGLPARNDY